VGENIMKKGFYILILAVLLSGCGSSAATCLSITVSHCYSGMYDTYITVVGTVENTCDRLISSILLRVKSYDEQNNIIGTSLGTTNSDILYPGAKSDFQFFVEGGGWTAPLPNCSVSVEDASYGD
jgi:hypothetical protein